MAKPFKGSYPITQDFSAQHPAIDYEMPVGTPLYACEASRVTYRNINQSDTGNGVQYTSNDGQRVWRSLHLDSFAVGDGQVLSEGQLIGYSGNTGLSTGPHLHQDLTINGVRQDPKNYYGNGGSNVDTINDDSGRQIGFHYLGRNGFDGKPNALTAPQGDIQGKTLSNATLQDIFLSAESKQYRDIDLPKLYADRDSYQRDAAQLRVANGKLQEQLDIANGALTKSEEENKALTGEIKALEEENAQLEKELLDTEEDLEQCQANGGNTNIVVIIVNWFKKLFKKGA
jgi:hypothetical protein